MTVGAFLRYFPDAPGEAPDCGKMANDPSGADWTAGEDFGSEDEVLLRKNCARILHRYLQKVMSVRDVTTGLPSYEDVRDIYDCRICAPHISQVLARGIMETRTWGTLQLFEGNGEVLKEEASLYISRMLKKGQEEI